MGWPFWGVVVLLCFSGLFSSSETAFFSLEGRSKRKALDKRVEKILRDPQALLVSLLAGNLFVNVLFFAMAKYAIPVPGIWGALIALMTILIFGEILPKAIALRMPMRIARTTAPFWLAFVRVINPVRRFVSTLLENTLRILGESDRKEEGLTAEALADALERSAAEGTLEHGEADLLGEIMQLSSLRVREIMTPRVDVLALDLEEDSGDHRRIVEQARRQRITWLPVIRGDMDSVEGAVKLRDLYTNMNKPLDQLVMPTQFVPEVAPVLNMLSSLRDSRVAEAVVVDEWGGTAGVVSLEDLFEELVGDLRAEGEEVFREVIPMGEGRYRVSGDISIRDWNETMGLEVVPAAFETLGGYILTLLGRLPKTGDRVEMGAGLVGEVHEVRGRRIVSVDLFLKDFA